MRIRITAMLLAGALSLPVVAMAADMLPKRGLTQDQVRKQYGAPDKMMPAVGSPPISRWVYNGFTVYFEGNVSLHAVSHSKPAAAPTVVSGDDGLPPIEVIEDTPAVEAAPAPAAAAAADTEAAEIDAAQESGQFRFDPVTGQIVEMGAAADATSEPAADEPVMQEAAEEEPAVEEAPAEEPVMAEEAATEEAMPEEQPAEEPVAGEALTEEPAAEESVAEEPAEEAPVAEEPADEPSAAAAVTAGAAAGTAASAAPAPAPTTRPEFVFDPVTGQIVVKEAASQPEPAAEPAMEEAPAEEAPAEAPAAQEPAADAEPATDDAVANTADAPEAESASSGNDGGFSMQW